MRLGQNVSTFNGLAVLQPLNRRKWAPSFCQVRKGVLRFNLLLGKEEISRWFSIWLIFLTDENDDYSLLDRQTICVEDVFVRVIWYYLLQTIVTNEH